MTVIDRSQTDHVITPTHARLRHCRWSPPHHHATGLVALACIDTGNAVIKRTITAVSQYPLNLTQYFILIFSEL